MSNEQTDAIRQEAFRRETMSAAVRGTLEHFRGSRNGTEDARAALRESILETARWRREKAAEFPNDDRNVPAAELLTRLAETAAAAEHRTMLNYALHWDSEEFGAAMSERQSEILRRIGFASAPATAEEIAREVLEAIGVELRDLEDDAGGV